MEMAAVDNDTSKSRGEAHTDTHLVLAIDESFCCCVVVSRSRLENEVNSRISTFCGWNLSGLGTFTARQNFCARRICGLVDCENYRTEYGVHKLEIIGTYGTFHKSITIIM